MGDSRWHQSSAQHSAWRGCKGRRPWFWPRLQHPGGALGCPQVPQGSSFDHPLAVGERKALPHQGCPTSTCYGTMPDQAEPWLSGPKFFPITWAEAQAPPAESPLTEPELQHTGSSGSPQGSSFDHPLAVGGTLVVGRSGALRSARRNGLSAEAVSWGPGTEVVARRFGVDHSFAALEPTNPREQPAGVSL